MTDKETPQGTTDPLETRFQELLESRSTRREFIKGALIGAALVTAATAGIGLPKFLEMKDEAEQAKRQTLLANMEAAKNKAEQNAILKASISEFLTEQAAFEETGNGYLNEMHWKSQDQSKPLSYIESKTFDDYQERAGLLMERGVVLLSSWDLLQSGNPEHKFDHNGRLVFEGRTLAVNENYADNLIAFNLIRSKLATLVETDPQKKSLAMEDYEALLKMVDIKPNLSVDRKCWIIMPQDWANALAKLTTFMEDNKIPPPQQILIEKKGGGLYEHGKGKKNPEKQQVLTLGSMDLPDVVFHEGGHYISDAQRTEKRLIGLPFTRKLPDFQTNFERKTGETQKLSGDLTDEIDPYVSTYAVTNPLEDFAETFKEFFGNGPMFRERIIELRKSDPAAADILEAKYEFMKKEVAGGTEFSFDGRGQRAEITEWEQLRMDKEKVKTRFNPQFDNELYASSKMKSTEGFEKAAVTLVLPKGGQTYTEVLSDPHFWTDFFNLKVESTSAIYPVPHFEIKGRFPVRIPYDRGPNDRGRYEIQLDTEDPESIKRFVEFIRTTNLPKLNITPPPFPYSKETMSLLKRLNLMPIRVNAYTWQASYPTQFIDQKDKMYIHLQLNESTQKWEAIPLDVRRVSVHKKENHGGEPLLGDNIYSPIRLGQSDIIIALGLEGNVQQILTSNL